MPTRDLDPSADKLSIVQIVHFERLDHVCNVKTVEKEMHIGGWDIRNTFFILLMLPTIHGIVGCGAPTILESTDDNSVLTNGNDSSTTNDARQHCFRN